jgi:hypothetical protein
MKNTPQPNNGALSGPQLFEIGAITKIRSGIRAFGFHNKEHAGACEDDAGEQGRAQHLSGKRAHESRFSIESLSPTRPVHVGCANWMQDIDEPNER